MAARRTAPRKKRPRCAVGLGASAGGLESLGRLLEGLPATFSAPILVALHLDPHHPSQLVPILQKRSRLPVSVAATGVRARAGNVYVAPPDHHLEVAGGVLRLTQAPRVSYSRPSIDVLFASIAKEFGAGAIAVVLSGTGSDGTLGVETVKEAGGLALAEGAATAAFPAMPAAAGRTGHLDAVLPVDQIPPFLVRATERRVAVSPRQWQRMLGILHARTGATFGRYRSSTLQRRLQHRLVALGSQSMTAYLDLLATDRDEVDRLHAAFLIKVSSFARDPELWTALAREIKPLGRTRDGLRCWSAGCATGEEAYTLAILLARRLGMEVPWKVFATDVDEEALQVGRAGRYTRHQVHGISGLVKANMADYFEEDAEVWRVRKELRSRVVFGRHDLLNDPPFSNIDILTCRNVLIYFKADEKEGTLGRLAAAMAPGGIMFLGRSEGHTSMPGFKRIGNATLFRRLDMGRTVAKGNGDAKRDPAKKPRPAGPRGQARRPPRKKGPTDVGRLREQQDLNEELQSRNEELETVNEELQSLNDELTTMEEQMRGLDEESRRTNAFLRLLLNTSPEVLIACDAKNVVMFWSKAAIKRFRLSPAQAIGGELFDLVPELDVPKLRAAITKIRKAGQSDRVSVQVEGTEFVFHRLPANGHPGGYVLRLRTSS